MKFGLAFEGFEAFDDTSQPVRSIPGRRSRMTKKKRPAKGDFAKGEREKPTPDVQPDFAKGEREKPTPDVQPDFARGEREKPTPDEQPDFARGERKTDD
jgi:hypothetical protein